MSMLGLRRSLRGCAGGPVRGRGADLLAGLGTAGPGCRAAGLGPATVGFYAEHVEADAAHEQVVRHGIIAPLVAGDPSMAADVVFGMQAALLLDERLSERIMSCWSEDRSALREPLPRG